MDTLPITKANRDEARRRGWVKTAKELFPEAYRSKSPTFRFCGDTLVKPPPDTEYWVAGSIGPCRIEIIK